MGTAEEFMNQLMPIFESLRQKEDLPCSYPLHMHAPSYHWVNNDILSSILSSLWCQTIVLWFVLLYVFVMWACDKYAPTNWREEFLWIHPKEYEYFCRIFVTIINQLIQFFPSLVWYLKFHKHSTKCLPSSMKLEVAATLWVCVYQHYSMIRYNNVDFRLNV